MTVPGSAGDPDVTLRVFQLLVYPMLDDRTTLRPASDFTNARVWLPKQQRTRIGHRHSRTDREQRS
jgi:hypothetical protein